MPSPEQAAPARRPLVRGLAGGAAALILVMLILGNANLVARWITGRQISGATELILLLLPMSVFAAVPRAEQEGVNVKSTALVDRLPKKVAKVVTGVGLSLTAAMAVLLVWATTSRALRSIRVGEQLIGVRNLPVWPARVVIALGLGVLLVVILGELWRLVRRGDTGEPAQGPGL